MKWTSVAAAALMLVAHPALIDTPAWGVPPSEAPRLKMLLDGLVRDAGVPGAQLVLSRDGRDIQFSSGVADVATGAVFPDDAQARIASNTKTFVAAVVLQLVAEDRVELDAPVESYLPGVVRGPGGDGNRVTVRNLLQHTSGIPDYLAELDLSTPESLTRYRPIDDLIRLGLKQPAAAEPGTRFDYSNTNYLLAGKLIEHVTGALVSVEVTRRIIAPLDLSDTYWPNYPAENVIRGPHPRAYLSTATGRADITDIDPNWGLPDGAIVSTGHDLNRFFNALLSGELVPEAQLAEMQRSIATGDGPGLSDEVGLALFHGVTASGVEIWGHGGSSPGFYTPTAATRDRAVTIILNQVPVRRSTDAIAALVDEAMNY